MDSVGNIRRSLPELSPLLATTSTLVANSSPAFRTNRDEFASTEHSLSLHQIVEQPESSPIILNETKEAHAHQELWNMFNAVDVDHNGAITPQELEHALFNSDGTHFDIDTIKMLMGMFDIDRNGTITFNEFRGLWKYIHDWRRLFLKFDRDKSGFIDGQELSQALRKFGYNLPPSLLSQVQNRYASTSPAGGPGRSISCGIPYDRFIRACVVVKQLTEAFQKFDTQNAGSVHLNYEQFMGTYFSLL